MKKPVPLIKLRNIRKVFPTGDEKMVALRNVNLTVEQGEFIAIMGPSGSGKSTLMYILGLLDTATSGLYCLDGEDISHLTSNKQASIRNQRIGFVFQQFNLLPRTTVIDNVLLPTLYGNTGNAVKRARVLLEQVDLLDRIKYFPGQLSGGQIQRVAIARALVNSPSIVLADEPTGNLDTKRSREIMKFLCRTNEDGTTVIVITHDETIAHYARRIIRLQDGEILNDSAYSS